MTSSTLTFASSRDNSDDVNPKTEVELSKGGGSHANTQATAIETGSEQRPKEFPPSGSIQSRKQDEADYPDTLASMADLASTYKNQGQ